MSISNQVKQIIKNNSKIKVVQRYVPRTDLFKDKVAVIANYGADDIVIAVARRFLSSGAKIIIINDSINDTEIASDKCIILKYDIFNISRDKIIEKCVNCYGRIDIWINCKEYVSDMNGTIEDFFQSSERAWDQQFDSNCKSLYFLTQVVAKYFFDMGISGHIVQVMKWREIHKAWHPNEVSKRVAMEFTRGIAKACAKYGIIVNGVVLTTNTERILGSKYDAVSDPLSCKYKRINIEEIVNIIYFLSSDMGNHMVGSIVRCAG